MNSAYKYLVVMMSGMCLLSGCGEKNKFPKITNPTVEMSDECKEATNEYYGKIDFSYCEKAPNTLTESFAMNIGGYQLAFDDFYFDGFNLYGTIICQQDNTKYPPIYDFNVEYTGPSLNGDMINVDNINASSIFPKNKNVSVASYECQFNMFLEGNALEYPVVLKISDRNTQEEKEFLVKIPLKNAMKTKEFTYKDERNDKVIAGKLTPLGLFIDNYDLNEINNTNALKINYDGQIIELKTCKDFSVNTGLRAAEDQNGLMLKPQKYSYIEWKYYLEPEKITNIELNEGVIIYDK